MTISAELTVTPSAARPTPAEFAHVQSGGAYALLPHFGVIDAAGDEAASFLHGQLTNDIEHLDAHDARLAGYCSPKGRLLASLLVWRAGQNVRLLLSHDLLPAVLKRLSMFVLRAKAKLSEAGDLAVVGFAGDVAAPLASLFDALPAAPFGVLDAPHGTLIRLPDAAGHARHLWIAPAETVARFSAETALPQVSAAVWDWLAVRAGEPVISLPTVEQFVPQMVNFDVIGAVNFRKGCYPGQEIVARSQYRGTLKRRTALAHIDADDVRAGLELFHSEDPGQPCGMVVNAAAAPGGGADALVEIKLAALEQGTIHAGSPSGPALRFEALPYTLPSET
jgi:tRNA-modifying protein YgfZ